MAVQATQQKLKPLVSVTAMAKAVGLSRSRFYDYVKRGVFPQPMYSMATRRPFYPSDMQEEILTTRQTGLTKEGEFVLFYERTATLAASVESSQRRDATSQLVSGLAELGLSATPEQIKQAMSTCFPNGTAGQDETSVLRLIYRHLRRANSG